MKKKISNKQLAKSLSEAVKGLKGADLEKVLINFVGFLVKQRKLKKAEFIISEFVKYSKASEGIREIKITSARKLSEKTIAGIKEVFGDKVEAEIDLDESLLGGIQIRTEDKILDASLKTQLLKLKQSLT